jgi:hypothetical protein
VTIEVTGGESEKSFDMMGRVYNRAVLPVVEDLSLRVQDVQVKCPRSWEPIGSSTEVLTPTDIAILRTPPLSLRS